MEGILSILGKVGFDWQVALANLVNFIIIFFILKKFAFKPIGKLIKERQEKIQKGLDDAIEAEAALSVAESTKEEIIKEAKEDARKIVSVFQDQGKEMIASAKNEANIEKENIIKQAKIDAEKEKKNIEDVVKVESANMIVSGIQSMVEGYVAKGKGEDLIKLMIQK
jgi:F-type H+-transporting ATPase subunit b